MTSKLIIERVKTYPILENLLLRPEIGKKPLDFDITNDIMNLLSVNKISTFKENLAESLKDNDFKKTWEESQVEYQLACELIEARAKRKLSQRELASKVGTSQAAISRIEAMNGNPSLFLLKRIANALNVKLEISF